MEAVLRQKFQRQPLVAVAGLSFSGAIAEQQTLEITRQNIHLQIHTGASGVMSHYGVLQGMRHDIQFKNIAVYRVDGKAGAITDLDGNFTINNVAPSAVLKVSYIGYTEQTIKVGNKVKITADAVPGVAYTVTVERISDATGSAFSLIPIDNATGNFVKVEQRVTGRIKLDNNADNGKLKGGYNVECIVEE